MTTFGQDGVAAESNSNNSKEKRVSTGVKGLDLVLGGGFLPRGFYLLQGDPGSGKTTLALQFARERARLGEKVLYVTITESQQDMERTARSHGWALEGIDFQDLSNEAGGTAAAESQSTLFHPAEVELGMTTRKILDEIERVKPQNVVFDGLSELRLLAGDAFTYRRQVLALKNYFEEQGITVILLDDRSSHFGEGQPETLVGGNILLERSLPGYGGARRRLSVTKVRGADFRSGYHDYEIADGVGVVVYPRLVAHHEEAKARLTFPSSISGLDELMDGGLTSGTTTLIMGPAGVGKSTVAMQYLSAALERGTPAAAYTFDEVLDTLLERTEKLCTKKIREYVASGLLQVHQVNPAELSPGSFASMVQKAVTEGGVRVVLIDSLNGYTSAMPEEGFLLTHLHELFTYLDQQGIVTIMVVAQHGLIAAEMSGLDISYLADTVLLLRYFEAQGEILQAIGVLKKRTGFHERTIRQLRITNEGLIVGEPLRQFRGIMTGVPQYDGQEPMIESERVG